MTVQIHRSERADALVRGLAGLLATSPDDPFVPDLVAVPSKGVERWIAQSLSTTLGTTGDAADGICANVLFPSPGRLVSEVVSVASRLDPDDDPWAEHRLAWALLDVVDRCAGEPWCRTLGRHLGLVDGGQDGGRRVGDRAEAGRAVHRVRRPAPRPAAGVGGGLRHRRRRRPLGDDLALAGRALAAAPRRGSGWTARPSASTPPACGCGRTRRSWTCPRGCRCSGRPG